jgi:hypothetical protein
MVTDGIKNPVYATFAEAESSAFLEWLLGSENAHAARRGH